MDMEQSEIRKRLESAIREGLDPKYVELVKALKHSFYTEDIAAAAIALFAESGGRSEVRRRTLQKAPFVPLKTRETTRAAERGKPVQRPAKLNEFREHKGHGVYGGRKGSPDERQQRPQVPQGQHRHPKPQGPQRPQQQQGPRGQHGPQKPQKPQRQGHPHRAR